MSGHAALHGEEQLQKLAEVLDSHHSQSSPISIPTSSSFKKAANSDSITRSLPQQFLSSSQSKLSGWSEGVAGESPQALSSSFSPKQRSGESSTTDSPRRGVESGQQFGKSPASSGFILSSSPVVRQSALTQSLRPSANQAPASSSSSTAPAASSPRSAPQQSPKSEVGADGDEKPRRGPPPEHEGGRPKLTKEQRRELQEAQRKAKADKKASAAAPGTSPEEGEPRGTPGRFEGSGGGGGGGGGTGGRRPCGGGGGGGGAGKPPKGDKAGKPAKQHAPVQPQYDDPKAVALLEKRRIVQRKLVSEEKRVGLFLHLRQFERGKSLTEHLDTASIHPAILRLGLQYAAGRISGSNARGIALLTGLREFLHDYTGTPGRSVPDDLQARPPGSRPPLLMASAFCCRLYRLTSRPDDPQARLRPLVQFLDDCRPKARSMGNVIQRFKRQLHDMKKQEATTGNLISDGEARRELIDSIDTFMESIMKADEKMVEYGVDKIARQGDVILTYARSHVVERILVAAHEQGKRFRVVVVDSRPKFEGRLLLQELASQGIPCTYAPIHALSYVMKEVTKVVVGAHSMFSNGTTLSRAGTANVCLMAHNAGVPVIICCEAYKFDAKSQLESITNNELGDPDELVHCDPLAAGAFAGGPVPASLFPQAQQPQQQPPAEGAAAGAPAAAAVAACGGSSSSLASWREQPNLKLLNLAYDLTPMEFVTLVITEQGLVPPTSVPVIIREYNQELHIEGGGS
eukprot:tig00000361_g24428.t1